LSSIFMRFPDGKAKALTLSYDDDTCANIKLIEIMHQYGLKGTFNLNSGLYAKEEPENMRGTLTEKMTTDALKDSGQEVAVHAYTHPFLEQLPENLTAYEILKDRENLEKQFGTIVRGMAYPFGTFNDVVIDIARKCGIVYSRTVRSTLDFSIPEDWMRLDPTCHHSHPELMKLAHKFTQDKPNRAPYLFYLWGHAYEFNNNDNWNVIEEFAAYIGGRDDVWYATNIEIYDYIDAYKKLQFSVDAKIIRNPTGQDLWLDMGGQTYMVGSGKVLKL